MKKEVVDCSILVKIFIPEPGSDEVLAWCKNWRLGKREIWTPQLAIAEFSNVIWHKVQRKEIGRASGRDCISDLLRLPINFVNDDNLIKGAFNLAVEHNVTVYDALYAALAYKIKVPLITADKKLVEKLKPSPVICKSIL